MAHLFDNAKERDLDTGENTRQEPPRWVLFAVFAGLALLGSTSALLWRSYGGTLPAMPSFASTTGSSAAPAAAASADKPVALKDFQAFQQQIAGSMQSTAQLLAVQQAEMKRLSDQVSVLAAKIDLLQRPAAAAQAALPAQAPQASAPAARKKPPARKPPASISVGGAPLPPPVQLNR